MARRIIIWFLFTGKISIFSNCEIAITAIFFCDIPVLSRSCILNHRAWVEADSDNNFFQLISDKFILNLYLYSRENLLELFFFNNQMKSVCSNRQENRFYSRQTFEVQLTTGEKIVRFYFVYQDSFMIFRKYASSITESRKCITGSINNETAMNVREAILRIYMHICCFFLSVGFLNAIWIYI